MQVAGPASGLNTPKENSQRFYEHSTQSIGELTEFKSGLMQQGAGLDEPKHDLTGLMTPDLVCPSTYQLLRSSSGDSGPDVSFDMLASPEYLFGSARARLATSTVSGQLRLSHPDCLKETIPYRMHTNTLRAELVYLDLRASEFMSWNLYVKVSKEFLLPYPTDYALFTRFDKYLFGKTEQIGTSGPMDCANIEAYLRGPLGLGKRASNVRIVWFSFGSFGSVSFCSSVESKNVVQLRLLWSTDATDSGPEPSFDRLTISGILFQHRVPISQIGTPSPADGANVEAYLCGPLGLGKRASNVRIVWFSFGSFGGGSFGSVSFGSSAESKNAVQL
ncbi:hypothetical protein Tco_0745338 [Tanacetum coccineum]